MIIKKYVGKTESEATEEARKELNREADVVGTMSRLNEEEQKRREEYAAQQALEAEKAAQEAEAQAAAEAEAQ